MKNSKTIKLNSKKIIEIRKSLDAEITKSFKIIRSENVMSKKEKNAGCGSGCDLKALYNHITQLQQKRIKIKGMLMYLNIGQTSFNFEEFMKTNNYHIFAACEAKEAITQLKMIPTLNPQEKAKKGKSNMNKTETFTSAKIASLLKDLQLDANKHDAAMESFNSGTDITISDAKEYDDFITYLTA